MDVFEKYCYSPQGKLLFAVWVLTEEYIWEGENTGVYTVSIEVSLPFFDYRANLLTNAIADQIINEKLEDPNVDIEGMVNDFIWAIQQIEGIEALYLPDFVINEDGTFNWSIIDLYGKGPGSIWDNIVNKISEDMGQEWFCSKAVNTYLFGVSKFIINTKLEKDNVQITDWNVILGLASEVNVNHLLDFYNTKEAIKFFEYETEDNGKGVCYFLERNNQIVFVYSKEG